MFRWFRRLLRPSGPNPTLQHVIPTQPVAATPSPPVLPGPASSALPDPSPLFTPTPSPHDATTSPPPVAPSLSAPAVQELLGRTVAFLDVETTGLHSRDRMVSLGLVLLDSISKDTESIALKMRKLHLIFDPGFKGAIDAEKVHGYDDWTLRHQDSFELHADAVSKLLSDADLICAHNMDFDWAFIERAFADLGRTAPDRPLFCTLQAARDSGLFHRAGLTHVAAALGQRQPPVHSALHDALLCMVVYLRLEMSLHWPNSLDGEAEPPSNLQAAPPRPEVLPRRRARKRPLPLPPVSPPAP